MRSNPVARTIAGAVALTLLAAGAVSAQSATPPPPQLGPTLHSAVVTSALDDAAMNELIEVTARDFHEFLGGRTAGRRDGWFPVTPAPTTRDVVEAALEGAQLEHDVVIISGGDNQAAVGIAGNFGNSVLLDLGQALPCVTGDGQADPSGTCAGGASSIPLNYSAIDFRVEEGAFLAGVLAAAASRHDRLGIISGTTDCTLCNRYVSGFVSGARSVAPDIHIEFAVLADDEVPGFGDPASAATFSEAFIEVYQPDVLLPVGRGASAAMIETACDAGILAVGTDIDISASYPGLAECVLTSVTRDMERAVSEAMHNFANQVNRPVVSYGLADGGVAITDEWQRLPTLPVDTAERFNDADTGLRTGQIDPCPDGCDEIPPGDAGGSGEAEPAGDEAAEAS